MGKITTVVTKYNFNKPSILSQHEYDSYKQILKIEPHHDLSPKSEFWKEFGAVKWCLIIFVFSFIIALITDIEFFGVIGLLTIFILILILISGEGSSMISYNNFERNKNSYYKNLKKAIISTKDYEEFLPTARKNHHLW